MQRRITTGVACIAVRTKRASPCTWHMATLWSTLRQYWTPKHDFNLINCYWTICVMTRNERLCIVWKEKCRHAYLWIPTLPGRTEIESDSSASFLPSAKISGASDVPTLVGMQSLPCYPKSTVRWSAMLNECIRKMCMTSKCTCEWYTSHCSTWCQTYTVDVGRYLANRTEILIQTALNWIELRLKKKEALNKVMITTL